MVALPVPAVAAEMCQGRPATLVGSPDTALVGTDGDDVIVTKGSRVILALDGNDRVCVTGKSGLVYAGFGDDVVDTTTASSGRSFLGPGADTYLGGPGTDFVKAAGNPGNGAAIGDQEVDVIDVGAGSATIYSGAPGKGNADTITVGDGTSTVYWSGYQTGGEVEFGAGRHRMQVFLKGDEPRDWRLGNGLGPDAGDQLVRWTGFVRDLSVLAFPDSAALTMLGSAAPELLKAQFLPSNDRGPGRQRRPAVQPRPRRRFPAPGATPPRRCRRRRSPRFAPRRRPLRRRRARRSGWARWQRPVPGRGQASLRAALRACQHAELFASNLVPGRQSTASLSVSQ